MLRGVVLWMFLSCVACRSFEVYEPEVEPPYCAVGEPIAVLSVGSDEAPIVVEDGAVVPVEQSWQATSGPLILQAKGISPRNASGLVSWSREGVDQGETTFTSDLTCSPEGEADPIRVTVTFGDHFGPASSWLNVPGAVRAVVAPEGEDPRTCRDATVCAIVERDVLFDFQE